MGDMSGGASAGKAGGGLGAGAPADTSGGLGLGGGMDPGAFGGGDLSGGFGGMDPNAFGGTDPSTFGGMDFGSPQAAAEFGAQQSGGTPNQPPITDQPSVPPQAPPQAPAPPQSPVQPGSIGHGDLLMSGIPQDDLRLTSTPTTEGMGTPGTQVASVKWLDTIGGAEAKPADPITGAKVVTPEIIRPPTGNVPPTAGASQGPMLQPEGDTLPHGLQGEGDPYYGRPQAADLTGSRYDAGLETGTTPPTSTASAGPMMAPGAIPDNLIKNTPPLTPETTAQPGTADDGVGTPGAGGAAPAGQGPQSPLEQLVSGFLHMLSGGGHGGLGPLEQLIARMVGINPNQLFPRFYGGNPFARQTGPGYFPPGTVGGRTIGPAQGVPPGGQRTPSPQRAPGAPQTPPGATRPTLAPSRRRQGGLPGGIYTGGRPDQPPPWYHPGGGTAGANTPLQPGQIQVPRGVQPPSGQPTQPNVDRSSFRSQLATNPQLIRKLAWMVNGEVGKNAPTQAKIVQLETAFNRAYQRGQSLDQVLAVHMRRGDGGYYAGNTYSREAMPSNAEIEQFKNDVLGPVMQGSNLSDVGYGPMTGNASGSVAAHQFARQHGYHLQGGDSYFREGPFNRPFPTLPEAAGF
jgi:hypothetical protein